MELQRKSLGDEWSPDEMKALSDKLMQRGEHVASIVLLQAAIEIEQLREQLEKAHS